VLFFDSKQRSIKCTNLLALALGLLHILFIWDENFNSNLKFSSHINNICSKACKLVWTQLNFGERSRTLDVRLGILSAFVCKQKAWCIIPFQEPHHFLNRPHYSASSLRNYRCQLTSTDPRDGASRSPNHRAVHRAGSRVWSTGNDRRQHLATSAFVVSPTAVACSFNLAFYDDTDILADIFARIVARMSACPSACHWHNFRNSCVSDVSARILARMSVLVSASASWNSSFIVLADSRCAVAIFSNSRVCSKGPERSTLIFWDTLTYLKHSVA